MRLNSVTIVLDHDGFYPIPGTGLKAYRAGSEVGLWYGDPASVNLGHTLSGYLVVEVVELGPSITVVKDLFASETSISFGQLFSFWWSDLQLDTGLGLTPLGGYIQQQLAASQLTSAQADELRDSGTWGPIPDPHNPEATGSGRVQAHTCPAGVALILGGASEALGEAGKLWVQAQGLRSCNVDWSPLKHPEWILGQGYNNSKGGFSQLYSSSMPPGMEGWPGVGLPPPHAQHMTIDALVWFSLAYGSFSAAQCAVGQHLSVASFRLAGESWGNSRAYGWFFKSTAYMAPLLTHRGTLVPHVSPADVLAIAERALTDLENRNWMGCPVVDSGSVSEGGHLDNDSVQALAWNEFGVEITHQQAKKYARSCNSWMTGVLAEGLANWLDLWDAYGWWAAAPNMRSRVLEQLHVCADFMLTQATRPGYSMDQQGSGYVPPWGIHDDVAPLVPLVQGGLHPNTPVGVYVRFLAGPCYAMARLLFADDPAKAAAMRGIVQPSLDFSATQGWWGNSHSYVDWVAEAGLEVVAVGGWGSYSAVAPAAGETR
ncbi:MAG: hypothetical protein DRQ55_03265 [Planctomycetota bacterium]|nr:MAG: hypothetical protein DRQ55_03265 [Planctomycetota bacterium]